MKFKIFALILGCMCMCFLPCLNGVVCAKVSSISASATVSEDTTMGQKIVQKLKKVKKELIIIAVGVPCFMLMLTIGFLSAPINYESLSLFGKVVQKSLDFIGTASLVAVLGSLISVGVKICS